MDDKLVYGYGMWILNMNFASADDVYSDCRVRSYVDDAISDWLNIIRQWCSS